MAGISAAYLRASSAATYSPAPASSHLDTSTGSDPREILKVRKPNAILRYFNIVVATYSASTTSANAVSNAILKNSGVIKKLEVITEKAVQSSGIGYFFYSVADSANSIVRFWRKPTLYRGGNLLGTTVTVGSATTSALACASKLGWMVLNKVGFFAVQVTFAVLNIFKSLSEVIVIHQYRMTRLKLCEFKPSDKNLCRKLGQYILNNRSLRSYLKDVYNTPESTKAFNNLVEKNPALALDIVKRAATQAMRRAIISLIGNILMSLGGLFTLVFPPISLAVTAVGGLLVGFDFIVGYLLKKSMNNLLQEHSSTSLQSHKTIKVE